MKIVEATSSTVRTVRAFAREREYKRTPFTHARACEQPIINQFMSLTHLFYQA